MAAAGAAPSGPPPFAAVAAAAAAERGCCCRHSMLSGPWAHCCPVLAAHHPHDPARLHALLLLLLLLAWLMRFLYGGQSPSQGPAVVGQPLLLPGWALLLLPMAPPPGWMGGSGEGPAGLASPHSTWRQSNSTQGAGTVSKPHIQSRFSCLPVTLSDAVHLSGFLVSCPVTQPPSVTHSPTNLHTHTRHSPAGHWAALHPREHGSIQHPHASITAAAATAAAAAAAAAGWAGTLDTTSH
jgi:hypothetical protein